MPGFHTQIANLSRLIRALESNVIDLNRRVKLLESQNKALRGDWRDLIKKVRPPDFKPSSLKPRRSYLEVHPDDGRMVESVIQVVLQLGPGVYSITYLHSLFPNLSPHILSKILKDYPDYFKSFRARTTGSDKRINFIEVLGTHHAPQSHPLQTPDGSS